jgi:AcrR family transcriptional regulator
MARRSAHTPEELRQRIVEAARGIIERDGLVGLSAREVARLIGYSPGTLYNIFENLDDVLLTLQTEMVDNFVDVMKAVPPGATPQDTLHGLTQAYLNFALDNRRMWNLLFTHQLPEGKVVPAALHDHINTVAAMVADLLAPIMPTATKSELDIAARALLSGVHGITAIAVTGKGPTLTSTTAHVFVKQLTSTYFRGLMASHEKPAL